MVADRNFPHLSGRCVDCVHDVVVPTGKPERIGSILGRVIFPFLGIYGASKFAVEALSDSLRYELSQLGIEVALVQPSAYPTSLFSSMQQPTDAVPESDEEFLQRYVI